MVAFLKYPIKIVVLKSSVPLLHPLPQGRDSLRGVVGMCFRNTGRKTRRSIYTTSLNGRYNEEAAGRLHYAIACASIPVRQIRGAGELAGAQRARGEPSLSVWSAKHAIARSAKGLRQQTRSHVQADHRSHNDLYAVRTAQRAQSSIGRMQPHALICQPNKRREGDAAR